MKVKSESEVTQSCPTQRPHGLQPTRLLCPWDFPGKSTGVGRHYLLQNTNDNASQIGVLQHMIFVQNWLVKLFLNSFSKKTISVCQDLITKYFIPQVYISSCNREFTPFYLLWFSQLPFPKIKQHLQVVEISLEFTSPESGVPPCKQTLSSPGSPHILHMYHDSVFCDSS